MKNYDVIVIGSGAGAIISDEAASQDLKVALIDKGPLIGGTCLNWGCIIPSKMLVTAALGNRAGVIGAAALARHRFHKAE